LNSRQTDKLRFVKEVLSVLLQHGYDANDTSLRYNDGSLTSNNLLHNLVSLVFASQTGYQLTCLYELMVTCLQHGVDANLEPYQLEPKVVHCSGGGTIVQRRPNYVLAQLCSPFNCGFSYSSKRLAAQQQPAFSTANSTKNSSDSAASIEPHDAENGSSKNSSKKSTSTVKTKNSEFSVRSCGAHHNSQAAHQHIDTAALLVNHYKQFVNLLFDFMRDEVINECLVKENVSKTFSASSNVLYSHLENLCASPRSLSSLTRRFIINDSGIRKPIAFSVPLLPLPAQLHDYLLFNEEN